MQHQARQLVMLTYQNAATC